jgi:hypothetical protein
VGEAGMGREVATGRYLQAGYAIKFAATAWRPRDGRKKASTIRMET